MVMMTKWLGVNRYLIVMVTLIVGIFTALSGAAAPATGLQGLEKQKRLRVLLPHKNKPISYIYEGEVRGIYIDILEYIADSQGIELDIQLVSFARANQLMLSSGADVAIVHSLINAERPGGVYLPYSKDIKVSIFALQDSEIEIKQESDLFLYEVGHQRIITDLQTKGAKVHYFKAPSYQIKALKAGRVELIILADVAAPYWEKTYDVRLKKVYPYRSNVASLWFNGLTLGSGAEDYCRLFVNGFSDLRDTGKFTNIMEKYNYPIVSTLFRSEASDIFQCVNSL